MNYHGIFKNYIGHEEFIWDTREKCFDIFKEIWQTEDLLCSFDGACFLPYKKRNSNKSWLHIDQSRYVGNPNGGIQCVQGLVNLRDNGPNDGGLLLLEGSQNYYNGYMNRHPLEGFNAHFNIDLTDPEISTCRPIKICAPKGHILLWDGKMVHCNVPPKNENGLRMCIYVSMQPSIFCDDKDRKKRITAAGKGRMTGPDIIVR